MPVAIAAAVPAVLGIVQAISGAIKAKKARNAIQGTPNPSYAPSKSINDYYQTALNRANTGPYNTLQYNAAKQEIKLSLLPLLFLT